MEFSRSEGVSSLSLLQGIFPTQGSKPGLLHCNRILYQIEPRSPALPVDFLPPEPQGKSKNTRVDSLFLLHWIFLTLESNLGLLHCRQILYELSYEGSPTHTKKWPPRCEARALGRRGSCLIWRRRGGRRGASEGGPRAGQRGRRAPGEGPSARRRPRAPGMPGGAGGGENDSGPGGPTCRARGQDDSLLEIESLGRSREVGLPRIGSLGRSSHDNHLGPLDWQIPEQVEA